MESVECGLQQLPPLITVVCTLEALSTVEEVRAAALAVSRVQAAHVSC